MDNSVANDATREYQFDTIKARIEGVIDQVVQAKCRDIGNYDAKQGQTWSNEIAEEIVRRSQEFAGKNFKLQCVAMILNKETSGFHMSASCFWDSRQDGNINKRYEFATFWAIITLFGISRM